MKTPHAFRICRAEWCLAKRSDALIEHAEMRLGVTRGGTTADGITLDAVYCVGNCANPPNILLDGNTHGSATPQMVDALIDELRS